MGPRSVFRTTSPSFFRRGAVLAEAKREADAEVAFKRVLQREPKHDEALNYLGYMLADRTTRLDEAIQLITQALEVDEDNPSYLDSLGWAYPQARRFRAG